MRAMPLRAQVAAATTVRGSLPSGRTMCCGFPAARCRIVSSMSIGLFALEIVGSESNQLTVREQVFESRATRDKFSHQIAPKSLLV
jgi:hypothetical protein